VLSALTVVGIFLIDRHVYGVLLMHGGHHQSLRILTWNIGKIYLPLDSRAADKDLAHVASVIKEAGAQIVALQELRDPQQLGRLLAALGSRWRGRLPEDAYDRRAALLTRLPARFIGLETSTGRTAQGAELTLPDGDKLLVASVHLDAFDPERRIRQAEEIWSHVEHLGADQVILAGDFNFDADIVEHSSADRRLYLLLSRYFVDAGKGRGGTTLTSRRLDYVFYRCKRVEWVSARVLRDRRINIMDHDPLLAELSLRRQTPKRKASR
jgi:endonuclease/exonuclease/phosphatase family metal-dependent hydrolase